MFIPFSLWRRLQTLTRARAHTLTHKQYGDQDDYITFFFKRYWKKTRCRDTFCRSSAFFQTLKRPVVTWLRKSSKTSCCFPAVGLNCVTRTEGQRTRCQTRVLTSQTTPPSGPLTSRTADLQSRRPGPPPLKGTPAHWGSQYRHAASLHRTFSTPPHRFKPTIELNLNRIMVVV